MARALTHSLPATTLEAVVRAHFGLSQAELGRYLGTGRAYVSHLEAGRRRASRAADQRLSRLGQLLPPPEGQGPVAPDFAGAVPAAVAVGPDLLAGLPAPAEALAPRPLRRRSLQVAAQASGLRLDLHLAGKGAALHRRRQWGLALLQAALPHWEVDATERAHLDRWLSVLAADTQAAAPTPQTAAAHALTLARLLALDVELAALAYLLAGR